MISYTNPATVNQRSPDNTINPQKTIKQDGKTTNETVKHAVMTTRSEQRPQLLYSASNGEEGAQNGNGKQERLGHGAPDGEAADPLTTTITAATPHNTATTPTPPSTTSGNTEGESVSESKADDEACVSGDGGGDGGGTSESATAKTPSVAPAAVSSPPSSAIQHHFFLGEPRPQLETLDPKLLQVYSSRSLDMC